MKKAILYLAGLELLMAIDFVSSSRVIGMFLTSVTYLGLLGIFRN